MTQGRRAADSSRNWSHVPAPPTSESCGSTSTYVVSRRVRRRFRRDQPKPRTPVPVGRNQGCQVGMDRTSPQKQTDRAPPVSPVHGTGEDYRTACSFRQPGAAVGEPPLPARGPGTSRQRRGRRPRTSASGTPHRGAEAPPPSHHTYRLELDLGTIRDGDEHVDRGPSEHAISETPTQKLTSSRPRTVGGQAHAASIHTPTNSDTAAGSDSTRTADLTPGNDTRPWSQHDLSGERPSSLAQSDTSVFEDRSRHSFDAGVAATASAHIIELSRCFRCHGFATIGRRGRGTHTSKRRDAVTH